MQQIRDTDQENSAPDINVAMKDEKMRSNPLELKWRQRGGMRQGIESSSISEEIYLITPIPTGSTS
jgi:hypothetical protein